jgi:hypothetical protein
MSIEPLKSHLSSELYETLKDTVTHHYVESENPNHHWNFIEVKNQTVLDLGCGFHLIESGWQTTPEFFISKGAIKIIGVDPCGEDIYRLKQMLPDHLFCIDSISSAEQVEHYINDNNITSLKMDIEGYETCFIDSNNSFPTLKHIAIETHNKDILNRLIYKLMEQEFTIKTVCTFYPEVYDVCNLVYASRES